MLGYLLEVGDIELKKNYEKYFKKIEVLESEPTFEQKENKEFFEELY